MSGLRRPRFLPFILTGAVIGFLLGAGIAASGRFEDRDSALIQGTYAPSAGIGYLGILGAALFALLAALVAVLLDGRSRRD